MVRYMKCPRCELNYIDAEKQEYCDVCLKEMKGLPIDIDEIEDAENELPNELCPVCGENMMRAGDKMCEECRKKAEYEEEEPNPDDDDEWREYLDDDTDSEIETELGEGFEGEFEDEELEEEEEEYENDEEDLEYVTGDEIYSICDDEDDEDDDMEGDDDF